MQERKCLVFLLINRFHLYQIKYISKMDCPVFFYSFVAFCLLACLKMLTNRNSLKETLNLQEVTVYSVNMGLTQYNE